MLTSIETLKQHDLPGQSNGIFSVYTGSLSRSQNDKASFGRNRTPNKATCSCFIFRVRGKVLRSEKAELKNCNLLILYRWFSLQVLIGEKLFTLGNFDITIGKNCVSRPLGMGLFTGTCLIRKKFPEHKFKIYEEFDVVI